MDHTTSHLFTCRGLVPHFVEDYVASLIEASGLTWADHQIDFAIHYELIKALDGTCRHEQMFERAVKYKLGAEHTSGAGKDLVYNGHNLELKTGAVALKDQNRRLRLELDLSEAKAICNWVVIAAYSADFDRSYFAVVPISKCKNKEGKLNASLTVEFDKKSGKVSSRKFGEDFYNSYQEIIDFLEKLPDRSNKKEA